jgi:hypothetical protein
MNNSNFKNKLEEYLNFYMLFENYNNIPSTTDDLDNYKCKYLSTIFLKHKYKLSK